MKTSLKDKETRHCPYCGKSVVLRKRRLGKNLPTISYWRHKQSEGFDCRQQRSRRT